MLIEIKDGITYHRHTPVYAPFLPDYGRICTFECVSPKCNAGKHLLQNGSGNEVYKNSFELRPREMAPKDVGDWIDFKSCPDCGQYTLIKA